MMLAWIFLFIFVSALIVTHSGGSCDRCEWSSWESWSSCSRTCGGYGYKFRDRMLCCKDGISIDECLKDCGKNRSGSFERSPCGNTDCYNGGWYSNNGCNCLWNYDGSCCEIERRHVKQPSWYFNEECNSGLCNWTPWESWEECSVSCGGGGTQRRERFLCCPEDYNYYSCLIECGIPPTVSRFDHRTCGETCSNGGNIKPEKFGCDCLERSFGHCCENVLPGCLPYPSDIIFVLDSSASQTVNQFKRQLEFVKTFIDNVNISDTEFQISVITFSWDANLEIHFNQSESREELKVLIDEIPFRPGVTNTHKGLRMAMDVARKSERRKGMVTFSNVIVLTDGMSTKRSDTKLAAKELKSTDFRVIAIVLLLGVGNQVSQQELRDISSPGDSNNPSYVFSVGDFNALDTVTKQLVHATCDECRQSYASDIQFLILDEELTAEEFQIVIDSMTHIVRNMKHFGIQNGSRLGVIRSSNKMQSITTLQESKTIEELLFMFQTLTLAGDNNVCEKTDIDCDEERNVTQTLVKTFDEIDEHKRENARQFLLILTSGRFSDLEKIKNEVELIRRKSDVNIFAIGPGLDVDMLGLLSLVNEASHVYLLRDSEDLTNLDLLHTEFSYNVCVKK